MVRDEVEWREKILRCVSRGEPTYLHLNRFNKRFYSGTPNLQGYHYANAIFAFPSSRYLTFNFFPPL